MSTVPVTTSNAPATTTTTTVVTILKPEDAAAALLANIFAQQQQPQAVSLFNPATVLQALAPTGLENMPSAFDLSALNGGVGALPLNNNFSGLQGGLMDRLTKKLAKFADVAENVVLKKVLPELLGLAALNSPLAPFVLAKDAALVLAGKAISAIKPESFDLLMAAAPEGYTKSLGLGSQKNIERINKGLFDEDGKLKKLTEAQKERLEIKLEAEKQKLVILEAANLMLDNDDIKAQLAALKKSIKETEQRLNPEAHADKTEASINKKLDSQLGKDKDAFDAKVTDTASWEKAQADLAVQEERLAKLKAFAETLADNHPDKASVDASVESLEVRVAQIQGWLDTSPHKV